MHKVLYASLAALCIVGASPAFAKESAPVVKDGDLKVPADYKSWPKFLTDIDKADPKQVRDIYINPTGANTKAGEKFPNGTISVMEIYKAQTEADGSLKKDANGKLIKGPLAKVYVMGKGEGWGATAPEGLKNGDWVYAAYGADAKTPTTDDPKACRGCHLPLGDAKDYIHRYDEYFQKRK